MSQVPVAGTSMNISGVRPGRRTTSMTSPVDGCVCGCGWRKEDDVVVMSKMVDNALRMKWKM